MKHKRLNLEGRIEAAKTHQKRLGATYIDWKDIKSVTYFGFAKKGFEDRWITLGHLRDGRNPFNLLTDNERENVAKPYAKKFGAKYIGCETIKGRNYFGFAKKGFEDRWVPLSSLRRGENPFNLLTHNERENKAKPYAKKFGASYIGCRKNKSWYEFGFAKDGFEDRWTTLGNLRNGQNPFNLLTHNERENKAKPYAKKFGASYIGCKTIRGVNYFGFAKEGFEDRWVPLGSLRTGYNPFNLATIGEQETEAKSHEKRLGAKYIGWNGKKGRNSRFGFAKEGFEDRWITLGHLREGKNPFVDSGFDVKKAGFFYILLVTVNGKKYIKFGITNNKQSRLRDHTQSLGTIGGEWSQLHIKRFKSGQECLDFETSLKRQFKSKRVNLGVNGFKEECFSHSIKDALFSQVL